LENYFFKVLVDNENVLPSIPVGTGSYPARSGANSTDNTGAVVRFRGVRVSKPSSKEFCWSTPFSCPQEENHASNLC